MRFILILLAAVIATGSAFAEVAHRDGLAAHYAALVRARTLGEPVRIHIVGDSKVNFPTASPDYRPAGVLAAASRGHPVIITTESFGGQNSYLWAHGEAADFLAERPDVDTLIVYLGTNERVVSATGGAQMIAQTDANFRAAHDLIRASRSPNVLSILYVGGTPANNWATGYDQTTAVMEEVNAVLAQIASDKNAGFFDPLSMLTRAHAEAGWMDQLPTPAYGGGNVHPLEPMNLVLWSEIARDLFPLDYGVPIGGTGIVYPALANGWLQWSAGYAPSAKLYPDGLVHLSGLIKPGTTAALTTLFTLPVGYRPATNKFYIVTSSNPGADCEIQVLASGVVRISAVFAGTYISLDGISF